MQTCVSFFPPKSVQAVLGTTKQLSANDCKSTSPWAVKRAFKRQIPAQTLT